MGVRSTRKYDLPDVPDEAGGWVEMHLPSQIRVRALKAEASNAVRLPGEEKLEAVGWAMMANVLHDSIKAWSFCEADGEPIPVTPENIDDLDNVTAQWCFDTVMGNETDEEKKAD